MNKKENEKKEQRKTVRNKEHRTTARTDRRKVRTNYCHRSERTDAQKVFNKMLYLEPIQVFDEVRRQLLGCHSNNFQQTVHSFLAYKTKQQKSNIAWKGYQDPHLVSYTFLSRCSPLSWSQDFNIFCCSIIFNSSSRLVACPHAPTIQFTRVILNSSTSHPAVQL